MKFYCQDWLKDSQLRLCSAATRGVFIDMLAMMHDFDKRGYLVISEKANGKLIESKLEAKQIARMIGEDLLEVQSAIDELIRYNVLKTDCNGYLYSKRMVAETELSNLRSASGKQGGRGKKKESIKSKPKANQKQNPEYEYEYEVDNSKIEWSNLVSFEVPKDVADLWSEYEAERKRKGMSSYSDAQRTRLMENLYKSANFKTENVKKGLIDSSTKGEKGIYATPLYYPPKEEQKEQPVKLTKRKYI